MRWPRWVVFIVGLVLLMGCGSPPGASTAAPAAATAPPTSAGASPAPGAAGTTSTPTPAPAAVAPAAPLPVAPSAGAARGGGLFLEVLEPAAEMVEVAGDTPRIAVAGRARPGAVVSVDGELLALDQSGAFRTEVPLEDEVTVVEVVASDTSGAEVRAQRVIVRNY